MEVLYVVITKIFSDELYWLVQNNTDNLNAFT